MIGQSPGGPRSSLLAVCRWPSRGVTSKQSRPMRTSLQPHTCVGGWISQNWLYAISKAWVFHMKPHFAPARIEKSLSSLSLPPVSVTKLCTPTPAL